MDKTDVPLTHAALEVLLSEHPGAIDKALEILEPFLKMNMSAQELKTLKRDLTVLKGNFRSRFVKSSKNKVAFRKKFKEWLESTVRIPRSCVRDQDGLIPPVVPEMPIVAGNDPVVGVTRIGRPPKPYSAKSRSAKNKHVKKVALQFSVEVLRKALILKLKMEQRGVEAKIIEDVGKQPGNAILMKRQITLGKSSEQRTSFTSEEALGLLLEMGFTKDQYTLLRQALISKGHPNILPSYYLVRAAKDLCRPTPIGCLQLTDKSAQVPLQNLLDHTARRIVLSSEEVVVSACKGLKEVAVTLVVSYGMDGSSGQSQYKQLSVDNMPFDDSNLFAVTIIPLKISGINALLWLNPRPQSSDYCRPLKLTFEKETQELVLQEIQRIGDEIKALVPLVVQVSDDLVLLISYELHLTIIDGKILSFITGTKSMQTCPLCQANPTSFNNLANLDNAHFAIKNNSWMYGASPLHAYIRFLECCLHISYRLEMQPKPRWKRSPAQMIETKERQRRIQAWLLQQTGLRVDYPKPGGQGNSNDGNTARRAFANYVVFASILGLDEELIKNFRTILIALNCQLPLSPSSFGTLCQNTAKLYVSKYGWYPMPSSVHKILIHGESIIRNHSLPVGYLGEEAGESRNKLYKKFRLHHSRKTSRANTMQDLFNRSLETSDPKLSSSRLRKDTRKRPPLPSEVIDLLQQPQEYTPNNQEEQPEDFIYHDLDFNLGAEVEV